MAVVKKGMSPKMPAPPDRVGDHWCQKMPSCGGNIYLELVIFIIAITIISAILLAMTMFITKSINRRQSNKLVLKNKLVVITGAAGGIGRQLALEFARRGARLALWDVNEEGLEELVSWLKSHWGAVLAEEEGNNNNYSNNGSINKHGSNNGDPQCKAEGKKGLGRMNFDNYVQTSVVDVSSYSTVSAAAHFLYQSEGERSPTVVISNAAVMRGKTLLQSTPEEICGDFDVNVLGAFWVAKAFLETMLKQTYRSEEAAHKGVLVTMGSIMAELPAAGQMEYCASKAALSQLHECLRWEIKKANADEDAKRNDVRSLLVQPYAVNTPMISGAALLGEGESRAHRRFAFMRRLLPPLDPADVARRVVQAVERGEERVYVPAVVGWIPLFLRLMPIFLRDKVLGCVGAFDGTDGFRGCAPSRSVKR